MTVSALRDRVVDALDGVNDPHVPASLRRMGMLDEVDVDAAGRVSVRVRVPCTACPGTALIEDRIAAQLTALPGVTAVSVELAWHLPWDRADISPSAQELMRAHGIQV